MTSPQPTDNADSELFVHYFGLLDERGIGYVVLHGYEDFPQSFSSDVDYAIADSAWGEVAALHRELGSWGSWRRVQCLRHEVTASYDVFMQREIPGCHLKLDFCSHYLRNGALLLDDQLLLDRRRRHNGFSVPAADVEFAYVLAKGLAKGKDIDTLKPVMQRLQREDPQRCQALTEDLLGSEGAQQVEAYLAADGAALDVAGLAAELVRRRRCGLLMRLRELARVVRRLLRPTGFSVAILGPDGVGKSTVIDGLKRALLPAFRRADQFHFRPNTFEPNRDGTPNTNPQGGKPRPAPVALAKLFYYYFDHLIGHFRKVRPLKVRSALVIFDRCYDDIIVDPLRFRIRGFQLVARVLRRLLPQHDLVLVLDAPPAQVYARKQELSLEELERQRKVFADFAAKGKHYRLIDAGQEPDHVLASCYAAVIDVMAERLGYRVSDS